MIDLSRPCSEPESGSTVKTGRHAFTARAEERDERWERKPALSFIPHPSSLIPALPLTPHQGKDRRQSFHGQADDIGGASLENSDIGIFAFLNGVRAGTAWYPGLPTGWQLVISWGEFCAGLAILLGFRCRWAAGIVLVLTTGTLIWWQGWNVFRLPLPAMEPTFMFLLFTLTLVFLGAGGVSLDSRGGGRTAAARSGK